MARRTLVCGSRYWGVVPDKPTQADIERAAKQTAILFATLDEEHAHEPITCVIEGEAPGADSGARDWAVWNDVPYEPYPADWKKFGRAAGPIRNTQMLDEGQPDDVVAFTPDITQSRGTANMVSQAEKRDIPVRIVGES